MARCKFDKKVVCRWNICTPKCSHFRAMGQTTFQQFASQTTETKITVPVKAAITPAKKPVKVVKKKEHKGITTTFYRVEK